MSFTRPVPPQLPRRPSGPNCRTVQDGGRIGTVIERPVYAECYLQGADSVAAVAMSDEFNYRIAAEDFGPIANADIMLRPLTIFIGPSNTGKSYLATLLYALHRSFVPWRDPWHWDELRRLSESRPTASLREDLNNWALRESGGFGIDLPARVAEYLQCRLEDASGQTSGLRHELCRCFGVDSPVELIRRSSGKTDAKLELTSSGSNSAQSIRYTIKLAKSSQDLTGIISGIDTQSVREGIASMGDGRKLLERSGPCMAPTPMRSTGCCETCFNGSS